VSAGTKRYSVSGLYRFFLVFLPLSAQLYPHLRVHDNQRNVFISNYTTKET
jgi:hypothetical protein